MCDVLQFIHLHSDVALCNTVIFTFYRFNWNEYPKKYTFTLFKSLISITLLWHNVSAVRVSKSSVERQTAVTAHLESELLLLFTFTCNWQQSCQLTCDVKEIQSVDVKHHSARHNTPTQLKQRM